MSISWAELHGEEDLIGTASDWLAEAARQRELNKGRVFCRVCEDFIQRSEMKRWTKDDDWTDLLCPGCDSVLVEDFSN